MLFSISLVLIERDSRVPQYNPKNIYFNRFVSKLRINALSGNMQRGLDYSHIEFKKSIPQ